jgi:hypothetical protein
MLNFFSYFWFSWLSMFFLVTYDTIMDFSDACWNILDFSLNKIVKTCKC